MSIINTTVKEYLEDSSDIIGKAPDSCEALEILNKARRLLWAKDWEGTIGYACVKVENQCVILPSKIAAVKEAWIGPDDNRIAELEDSYYFFIDKNLVEEYCRNDCGRPRMAPWGKIILPGITVNCLVTFKLTDICDDVDIDIAYKDSSGGRRNESFQLTEDKDSYTTQYKVNRVIGLKKKEAEGGVDILQFDKKVDYIEYFETNPSNEVYKVYGGTYDSLVIRGKLRFYKYGTHSYNQNLDLNPDALDWAVQAVQVKGSGSIESTAEYREKLNEAERHLEMSAEAGKAGFGRSLPSENYPKVMIGHDL